MHTQLMVFLYFIHMHVHIRISMSAYIGQFPHKHATIYTITLLSIHIYMYIYEHLHAHTHRHTYTHQNLSIHSIDVCIHKLTSFHWAHYTLLKQCMRIITRHIPTCTYLYMAVYTYIHEYTIVRTPKS